jgi:hypothetical protein
MLQMLIFIYAVVSLAFFAYMLLRPFFLKFVKKNSTGAVKTATAAFKGEEVAFSPGEKTPEPSPHPDTVRRYP